MRARSPLRFRKPRRSRALSCPPRSSLLLASSGSCSMVRAERDPAHGAARRKRAARTRRPPWRRGEGTAAFHTAPSAGCGSDPVSGHLPRPGACDHGGREPTGFRDRTIGSADHSRQLTARAHRRRALPGPAPSPPGDLNPQPLDYKSRICRPLVCMSGRLRSSEIAPVTSELRSSGPNRGQFNRHGCVPQLL
jgi:hypothetical protein